MKPDKVNSKLEEYCKELFYIQQSFFDFHGLPTLPPAQLSKYNTLIIAIVDFLNDAFVENRYEPMIKKIHNDCIAVGLFEPTPGSIEGIISVLRAAIIRVENNPNCTAMQKQQEFGHESTKIPNPATSPPTQPNNHQWYQKPIGVVWLAATGSVLAVLIGYLIKKYFGIPV